uniref:Uncharacterized protein n=1 Tax=Panagrolaimus davidi TaxID=227884 RepID=A0A914PYE5_9BILA
MPRLSPQLIIIDKNRNVLDFTKCKIIINKITKKLNVIPGKREICKKIFDIVQNAKEIDAHGLYRFRKHIEKLLRDAKVKTKLVKNVYEIVVDEKNELVLRANNGKRCRVDSNADKENSSSEQKKPKNDFVMMKQIYEIPYFEKVIAERKEKLKKRLLIFPNNDKIYHFEYYWNRPLQCYQCCGCGLKADIIKNDKNEKEFVKHKFLHKQTSKHFCKLRKYDEAKFTIDVSKRIIERQNYKIIKYTQKGISTSKLFIFDSTNKNLCRGYYWENDNKYYLCIGCTTKAQRVFAKICKNMDGMEYLMLSKNEHVCELREYNPEKYKNDIIVKKPMFKHVECTFAGITRKYLLIFTDKECKFYYKFSYEHGYLPICVKCSSKNLHIPAYILKDDNGEEYVSVRDKKHLCEPIKYNPSEHENNQILKPPRYQIIKRYRKANVVEKLVVFDSNDNSLCYEYTLQPGKSTTKKYKCNECHHKYATCVSAWIINYGKENEYVELSKTQHKCPSKKPKEHLLIYSSIENEKLCYRYYFDSIKKQFWCLECISKNKKIIFAKIFKDENDEDFIQLGEMKHLCKPQPEKAVLKKLSSFYTILN